MNKKLNILLIEDDDVDAEAIERSLRKTCQRCMQHQIMQCNTCIAIQGFLIERATTLNEGLQLLEKAVFDVLILDLGLPDIDGVNAEKSVRAIRVLKPLVTIIVLTGQTELSVALASLREGAQDYLVKGEFTANELQRCIRYSIERHRLKLELERTAHQLAQKSSVLQSVIDHMGDGVVVVDKRGKPTLLNPAAYQLLDVSWMEKPTSEWENIKLASRKMQHLSGELDGSPFRDALSGKFIDQEEYKISSEKHPDGKYLSVTVRPISDIRSNVDGCVAVMHDITKRRKTEKLKDEFVSVISHELRTPLTSINGSLGLVLGGVVGDMSDGVRDMLHVAERNSNRLIGLINDLLDIQKLEAGQFTLSLASVNTTEMIEKALESNNGYAKKHNVRLAFDTKTDEPLFVHGDEGRLLQVMANLLSNAIKHSPEGEVVSVTLERHADDAVKISVIDRGPGIPEDFHDAIFEKFTQADASISRKKQGTGLGLSICRSIISLHGGDIGFKTGNKEGTTFYFVLPIHTLQGALEL